MNSRAKKKLAKQLFVDLKTSQQYQESASLNFITDAINGQDSQKKLTEQLLVDSKASQQSNESASMQFLKDAKDGQNLQTKLSAQVFNDVKNIQEAQQTANVQLSKDVKASQDIFVKQLDSACKSLGKEARHVKELHEAMAQEQKRAANEHKH